MEPEIIDGAQFLNLSFSCDAGVRTYKLYIPKYKPVKPRPLLIMLHGCKQNPSDFAIGTRNERYGGSTRNARGIPGSDSHL